MLAVVEIKYKYKVVSSSLSEVVLLVDFTSVLN